jgi:pyridoxal phosphate enzyme (YggS family)
MSADSVAADLVRVRERIAAACRAAGRSPDAVALLAVSKTHGPAMVRAAYAAGQRLFGENRVQELCAKAAALRDLPELRWHLIGSLQTNKVRDLLAVPGLEMVQSLDRVRLADELHKECARAGRSLDVLLQVHATAEPTKHGCAPGGAAALLAHVRERCAALRIKGLMAIGPLHGDPAPVFAAVQALRADLQRAAGVELPVSSLGMSGDLEAAVAAGSTMVRIGTDVFGARLGDA